MKLSSLLVCCASLALVLTGLCGAARALVEPQEPKIQARVEFTSMAEWNEFLALEGLDFMKAKPGAVAVIVTDADQLAEIRDRGFDATVEIDNMQEFYARRIRGDNFGDFHTFSETVDFLDALHASYPSITTAKESIGTTHEGRSLWVLKISDNPDVNEDEPEVLYDAMHHAREPITVECLMHYMTWLCENYGTDPEATYLVDNREIYFFPIVNPDGFVYNESTYPTGGGMWRKNRRDNEYSPCYGVDPNRNYPFEWGGASTSTDPCNDLYLGPSAGSEPEIQAYMDFVAAHDFVTNISFHSVVGCVLIPWSYTYDHTADDAAFRHIADEMVKENGYAVGQAGELLYLCSGVTCDWAYAIHDVWSVCIEVAGSGFWPAESEIPGLREENLWSQIYITRIAGAYLAVDDHALSGGDGDDDPEPGETLDLVVTVENQGVETDALNTSLTISTDDPYVQLNDATATLGTIAAFDTLSNASDPFSYTLDASTPDGHLIELTVEVSADGFYAEEEITWLVGTPATVFFDDMEVSTTNWVESDGKWGLTSSKYHSASKSYTDSPTGDYANSVDTWIELADPIDLTGAVWAGVSFWHWYSTESGYDYCYVEASTDGGSTWERVAPRYHGASSGWVEEDLSLVGFVGTPDFKLRFRLKSDLYITDDGWYVDDVTIAAAGVGNARPTPPTLDGPAGGSTVGSTPTLSVVNASDTDPGDVLTYGFIVYSDELCTSVVISAADVPEGASTTQWTVGSPLSEGTYWWRSYADDGTERGPLMAVSSFTVDTTYIDDEPVTVLALGPGRPNPFRAETELAFELPSRVDVEVAVYGVDGRLVRILCDRPAGPGRDSVVWNGQDRSGNIVANGLYFVELRAGNEARRAKVVVLR